MNVEKIKVKVDKMPTQIIVKPLVIKKQKFGPTPQDLHKKFRATREGTITERKGESEQPVGGRGGVRTFLRLMERRNK